MSIHKLYLCIYIIIVAGKAANCADCTAPAEGVYYDVDFSDQYIHNFICLSLCGKSMLSGGEIYRALNVDYNKRLPNQDGVG